MKGETGDIKTSGDAKKILESEFSYAASVADR